LGKHLFHLEVDGFASPTSALLGFFVPSERRGLAGTPAVKPSAGDDAGLAQIFAQVQKNVSKKKQGW